MSECARVGKWIGGCRFEARYDTGGPTIKPSILKELVWSDDKAEAVDRSRSVTYIHDICVRCGKIVEPSVTIENAPVSEPKSKD